MVAKSRFTFSTANDDESIVRRTGHGQGVAGLQGGLSEGFSVEGAFDCVLWWQQWRQPADFTGVVVVVYFGVCLARMQHQACGNARSRLQASASDRMTRLHIPRMLLSRKKHVKASSQGKSDRIYFSCN
jgi:hypothetical protein